MKKCDSPEKLAAFKLANVIVHECNHKLRAADIPPEEAIKALLLLTSAIAVQYVEKEQYIEEVVDTWNRAFDMAKAMQADKRNAPS